MTCQTSPRGHFLAFSTHHSNLGKYSQFPFEHICMQIGRVIRF